MPISGVNLYLVLWRAARAAQSYDHSSIEGLGLNVTDFAVLPREPAPTLTDEQRALEAARSGDADALRALGPAAARARDPAGLSALHHAAWAGRLGAVQASLELGAKASELTAPPSRPSRYPCGFTYT